MSHHRCPGVGFCNIHGPNCPFKEPIKSMLIAMEQQSISAQAEILIKEREKHELQRKEMLTMLAIAIRKLGGKLEVDDLVLTTAESLTPTIIGSYCSDMRATIYTIEGEEPK